MISYHCKDEACSPNDKTYFLVMARVKSVSTSISTISKYEIQPGQNQYKGKQSAHAAVFYVVVQSCNQCYQAFFPKQNIIKNHEAYRCGNPKTNDNQWVKKNGLTPMPSDDGLYSMTASTAGPGSSKGFFK